MKSETRNGWASEDQQLFIGLTTELTTSSLLSSLMNSLHMLIEHPII